MPYAFYYEVSKAALEQMEVLQLDPSELGELERELLRTRVAYVLGFDGRFILRGDKICVQFLPTRNSQLRT